MCGHAMHSPVQAAIYQSSPDGLQLFTISQTFRWLVVVTLAMASEEAKMVQLRLLTCMETVKLHVAAITEQAGKRPPLAIVTNTRNLQIAKAMVIARDDHFQIFGMHDIFRMRWVRLLRSHPARTHLA